jgi:hypothetical protein
VTGGELPVAVVAGENGGHIRQQRFDAADAELAVAFLPDDFAAEPAVIEGTQSIAHQSRTQGVNCLACEVQPMLR